MKIGDERRKREIEPFDRTLTIWSTFWDNFLEKSRQLAGREKQEFEEDARRQIKFFVLNYCNPAFHRLINKKTDYLHRRRKKGAIIRRHLVTLTRFILLDKLKQEFQTYATLHDFRSDPLKSRMSNKGDPGSGRTKASSSYKQLSRFVNLYYPEIVSTPAKPTRRRPDARFQAIETPFSRSEILQASKKYLEMINWGLNNPPPQVQIAIDFGMRFQSRLRMCDPDDIAKLIAYRSDVETSLKHTEQDLTKSGKDYRELSSYWMIDQFKKYGPGVQALFQELRWYVELKWFARKNTNEQRVLVADRTVNNLHFVFSEADAREAVGNSQTWFNDPVFVFRVMVAASVAFVQMDMANVAISLMTECDRQLDLPAEERALCRHNMAMNYRLLGDTLSAIDLLRDAIDKWKDLGNHTGDEAIEHAYLAELFRSQGNRGDYESQRLIASNLMLNAKNQPYFYLELADCANGFNDIAWEIDLLTKGLVSSSYEEKFENYYLYFGQCLNDLQRPFRKRGPEYGPGRVQHPPQWEDMRLSSFFGELII